MSRLSEIIKTESAKILTENGAVAYNTTNNALIDLFAVIGAMRTRDESDIISMFENALAEDKNLAMKMLFYCGDVRGGLGERRTFKIILKHLAKNKPSLLEPFVEYIPFYNRWDTVLELFDTPLEDQAMHLLLGQLTKDSFGVNNKEGISLCAKWMPSINTSSAVTRAKARKFIKYFGLSEKTYRQLLSTLRGYLNVTEKFMSAKEFEKIDYPSVPSYAMKKYRNAFYKKDGDRFSRYIESVSKGEAKINSNVMYPYDLVRLYTTEYDKPKYDAVIEEQWKALPNYVENDSNVLIMADVSGSMFWTKVRPIDTSVGLAIYFAERNRGPLEGCYMSFTSTPEFRYVDKNKTLLNKVQDVLKNAGLSTNLEAAFELLLKTAVNNNFSESDMPSAICVISDMEINSYRYSNLDFVEEMKTKYESAGYKLPKLILWNVEARQNTFLSQSEDVIKVSGLSTSIFKNVVGALDGKTAYDFMCEVLLNERYSQINV